MELFGFSDSFILSKFQNILVLVWDFVDIWDFITISGRRRSTARTSAFQRRRKRRKNEENLKIQKSFADCFFLCFNGTLEPPIKNHT